jgi:hypothetical protein
MNSLGRDIVYPAKASKAKEKSHFQTQNLVSRALFLRRYVNISAKLVWKSWRTSHEITLWN